MKLIRKFSLVFLAVFFFQTSLFAIETNAGAAEASMEKGMQALKQNQPQEALQFFRQAKTIDPTFAPAYVGEAEILTIQNAWDEALALLNRAVELAPDFGVAYHNRGVLRYYRGEYREAHKDLARAMKMGETVEPAMLTQVWGAAFPDEMIKKMSAQISANSKDAEAYLNRGIAYFHKNDFQSTLTDWKKAKQLGAEPDPGMWYELERQIQLESATQHAAS